MRKAKQFGVRYHRHSDHSIPCLRHPNLHQIFANRLRHESFVPHSVGTVCEKPVRPAKRGVAKFCGPISSKPILTTWIIPFHATRWSHLTRPFALLNEADIADLESLATKIYIVQQFWTPCQPLRRLQLRFKRQTYASGTRP